MVDRLYFSSLRGTMGDWIYYPCLMSLKDVAERVNVAEEIYESKSLSDMVQRILQRNRGKEIKDYLLSQDQRFFNSIIIAVYGGEPNWIQLERFENKNEFADHLTIKHIPEEIIENVGILAFTGGEKLFALDGQHRLIGIKQAVKGNAELGKEKLSVIFVAHQTDTAGKIRSRRLFTTLNKNAKAVSKGEIIALDEDDTMAITVRRLIREYPMFKGERIAKKATTNLSANDYSSLTTIANLYDILALIFVKIMGKNKQGERKRITKMRLDDEKLEWYFNKTCEYFDLLTRYFSPLDEFLQAEDYISVVKKYRHVNGGSILFRPVGLSIITEVVAKLSTVYSLDNTIKKISKIPLELTDIPFKNVIWRPSNRNIYNKGKTLAINLLLYMINEEKFIETDKMIKEYANILDVPKSDVVLPEKLYNSIT